MREDDGRSAGIQRVVHGGGRRVRQVNDDAESIHLFDHQLGTYQSMAHEKEDKKEMYTREWELKNILSSYTQSSTPISLAHIV